MAGDEIWARPVGEGDGCAAAKASGSVLGDTSVMLKDAMRNDPQKNGGYPHSQRMYRYLAAVCGEQAAYRNPDPEAVHFFKQGARVDISALGWSGMAAIDFVPWPRLDDVVIDEGDAIAELAFVLERPLYKTEREALANLLWDLYGSRVDRPEPACARFVKVWEWPRKK